MCNPQEKSHRASYFKHDRPCKESSVPRAIDVHQLEQHLKHLYSVFNVSMSFPSLKKVLICCATGTAYGSDFSPVNRQTACCTLVKALPLDLKIHHIHLHEHTNNTTHTHTGTQQELYTLIVKLFQFVWGIIDNICYFTARKVGRSCDQNWRISVFMVRSALLFLFLLHFGY